MNLYIFLVVILVGLCHNLPFAYEQNYLRTLTSFDNSEDHVFMVRILLLGIQCSYTLQSSSIAACPAGLSSPPMRTLSALRRSLIAVPVTKKTIQEIIFRFKYASMYIHALHKLQYQKLTKFATSVSCWSST